MGEDKQRKYWECRIGSVRESAEIDVKLLDIHALFYAQTGEAPRFIFSGWKNMSDLPEKYQAVLDKRDPDLNKVPSNITIEEAVLMNKETLRLKADVFVMRNCMNCGRGTKPDMNARVIAVSCTLIESAATKCRERNLCRWEPSDN